MYQFISYTYPKLMQLLTKTLLHASCQEKWQALKPVFTEAKLCDALRPRKTLPQKLTL